MVINYNIDKYDGWIKKIKRKRYLSGWVWGLRRQEIVSSGQQEWIIW
jgi:hypothetical protein